MLSGAQTTVEQETQGQDTGFQGLVQPTPHCWLLALCSEQRGPQNGSKGTGDSATMLWFCLSPGLHCGNREQEYLTLQSPKSMIMLVIVKQEEC